MSVFGKLASNVGKLGVKAFNAASSAIDRVANNDEFEAVIAAIVLVASADGAVDKSEREAGIRLAAAHPVLQSFSAAAITAAFNENFQVLGMDRTMGTEALMAKVRKVTDLTARTRIIGIAETIANADGQFSTEEKAVVQLLRGV